GDLTFLDERGDAIFGHVPAFAFGEGLAEVGEVGEGFHGADASLALELSAKGLEIKLGFEVMHTGLEERFAMQRAPEADGAEGLSLGKWVVREVQEQLIGSEIDLDN